MNMRLLAATAVALLVSAPAFAATTYYVAHKPNDKVCAVVTKKPNGKTSIMVGTAGYNTKAKATAALKAAPDCK